MKEVGFAQMLTFFFVLVGPFHILGPFAHLTSTLPAPERMRLALRTAGSATVALLAGMVVGSLILQKWHVTPGALLVAGSGVLCLVALSMVLRSTGMSQAKAGDEPSSPPAVARTLFSQSPRRMGLRY